MIWSPGSRFMRPMKCAALALGALVALGSVFAFSAPASAATALNGAKLDPLNLIDDAKAAKSKLILVTALSPTPAGEGKTTTSIGLNEGLNKLGKKSIVVLREPSLGPVFGMKGGAAGPPPLAVTRRGDA